MVPDTEIYECTGTWTLWYQAQSVQVPMVQGPLVQRVGDGGAHHYIDAYAERPHVDRKPARLVAAYALSVLDTA